MRWLLAVLVLGRAASALSAPLMLSGFQTADQNSGTARDVMEFAIGSGGGSTDADLRAVKQNDATGAHTHNANNGGWGGASTQWGILVDVASGEQHWMQPYGHCSTTTTQLCDRLVADASDGCPGSETCVGPWAIPSLSVGVAMHLDSAPGIERRVLELVETDGSVGCYATVTTSRTLKVYYGTEGTARGESATALRSNACATDDLIGCTTGGDCVDGTCGSCSATTGGDCFWAGIELAQRNLNPSVACDLWINGREEVNGGGGLVASGLDTVATWRLGAPGTEAGTLTLSLDDLIVDSGPRAHFGFVASAAPSRNGPSLLWTDDTCGGSGNTSESACWGDWNASGTGYAYYNDNSTNTLQTGQASKTEAVSEVRSGSGLLTVDLPIGAVETVVVGRTSTTGSTRTLSQQLLTCTSTSTCVSSIEHLFQIRTSASQSDHFLFDRAVWLQAPSGPWTAATLQTVGLQVRTTAAYGGQQTRLGAALVYAFGVRPDAPPQITLREGNYGTDDGILTIASDADSSNGGTHGVTCQGGTNAGAPCSQDTYCSQASVGDWPPGGCTTDADCAACSSDPTYRCSVTSDCDLGTCVGNVCTGDSSVACAGDGDCQKGTCSTAHTCIDACVGGECPINSYAGPGLFIPSYVGADVVLQCARGAETSHDVVATARYQSMLQGRGVVGGVQYCIALEGCTDASRCHCSTTTGTVCRAQADCPGGEYCQFPPVDVAVVWWGLNDYFQPDMTPDCRGPWAGSDYCSAGCTGEPACTTWASDCSSIATNSRCVGHAVATTGTPTEQQCLMPKSGFGAPTACTALANPCRSSADCQAGQSCVEWDGSTAHANLAERDPTGICSCGADGSGNCPSGYACRGAVCRRSCAADADCGTGGICTTSGTPKVCKGRCSCPCDAWNGGSCSTDAQCPSWTTTNGWTSETQVIQPICTGGKCACCGLNGDPESATCPGLFQQYYQPLGHLKHIANLKVMQDWVDGLSEVDGRPRLYFSTIYAPRQAAWHSASAEGGRPNGEAVKRGNRHLLWSGQFPHVVDMARADAKYPISEMRTDSVHLPVLAAQRLAQDGIAPVLNASATCATGQCVRADAGDWGPPCVNDGDCSGGATCRFGAWASPQRYCRAANGTWTSTPCTTTCADATQACLLRPCTCTCQNNSDCVHWYGAGYGCKDGSNGTCDAGESCTCKKTSDNSDACAVVLSGGTCQSGICKNGGADACPASGDVCNAE